MLKMYSVLIKLHSDVVRISIVYTCKYIFTSIDSMSLHSKVWLKKMEYWFLKFIWKGKKSTTLNTISKESSKVGRLTPDFQTYFKATVITMVRYW